MAKQCTVCKQSYPDHLESCPHCAEAVEVIDAGAPAEISDPDSAVIVELQDHDAEIIRTGKNTTDSHSEVDLQLPDAPAGAPTSDSDSEFDLPPPVAPAANKPLTPSAVDFGLPPTFSPENSGSDVPIGEQGPVSGASSVAWSSMVESGQVDVPQRPDQIEVDSPSDVDLLRLAQNQEAAAAPPPATPKDFAPPSGETPAAPGQPSGLRLVDDALEGEDFSGVIVGGTRRDRLAPTETSRQDLARDPAGPEGDSGVNLGELPPHASGERPSGRDLIAEAVESGVDLRHPSSDQPADSESAVFHGAGSSGDSAVDLGSSTDTGPTASDEPRARTDLGGLNNRDMITSDSELELNVDALDEEAEMSSGVLVNERRDEPPDEDEERAYTRESLTSVPGLIPASAETPERISSGRGVLTGLGLGALGGMALAFVLWIAGVEPPAGWRLGGSSNKTEQTSNTTASSVPPPAATLDAGLVQNLKDRGFAVEPDHKPADVVVLVLGKHEQLQKEANGAKDQANQATKDLEDLRKKGADDIAVAKQDAEKSLKESQDAARIAQAQAKELSEKLKSAEEDVKTARSDSKKYEGLAKGNAEELKAAKDQLVKVDVAAKSAEDKGKALADKLKDVETRFESANVKAADLTKQVNELAAARKETETKLAEVGKRLEDGKIVAAKADQAEIVKGVDRLVALAKTSDPGGQLAASKLEAQKYQTALTQRHTPQEMLTIWLPLFKDRARKDGTDKALSDVARVLKESDSPAAKGEALTVQGLALRNQGKFAEARASLEKALQEKSAQGTTWRVMAQATLKELSDPNVYYLPHAEQLQSAGDYPAALDALNQGLKIFAKDNGQLLALRSHVLLDTALAKAKSLRIQPDDANVVAARGDAQAALAAGAVAEGNFAAGRIAEELGNSEEARQAYQKALNAKPDNRYRLALARVLLKVHQERATRDGNPKSATRRLEASSLASFILLMNLAGPDDAAKSPERDEALRLADQILASTKDDPAGLLLKAQALAIKGQWIPALTTYVEGIRPRLTREQVDGLLAIINNLPTVKRPETVAANDPDEADKYYAAGLRLYGSHQYAEAEKEFTYAVQLFAQDARYFYYFGLSRLMQGKRAEAFDAFEQAAKLERKNRPDRATVSQSLERVQGIPRREMDKFRP